MAVEVTGQESSSLLEASENFVADLKKLSATLNIHDGLNSNQGRSLGNSFLVIYLKLLMRELTVLVLIKQTLP